MMELEDEDSIWTSMPTNPWDVDEINAFSYFCCPECDYKSQSEPGFVSHASENHPNSKGFCDKQTFKNEPKYEPEDLKENLILEQANEEENSSILDEDFTEPKVSKKTQNCPHCHHVLKGGKKSLKDHIKRKHQTVKVSCPECHRNIKENALQAHLETCHSGNKNKKFKCLECDFESNNATSLSNHVKYMHPGDESKHPFACQKCAKTFPYASGLQQHVDKVHLKLKSFVCEKCGKGFNSKNEFIEHQNLPSCNFMTSTDVIFHCDKCTDQFNTVKGYIRHHEVLHGDFPSNLDTGPVHLCDECPKIYLKAQWILSD